MALSAGCNLLLLHSFLIFDYVKYVATLPSSLRNKSALSLLAFCARFIFLTDKLRDGLIMRHEIMKYWAVTLSLEKPRLALKEVKCKCSQPVTLKPRL